MLARFLIPLLLLPAPALAFIPQDLATTTTPLGQLALGIAHATAIFSPDNSRLAYPAAAGSLSPADRANFMDDLSGGATARGLAPIRLYIDGSPSPATDSVTSPIFSPDSHHVGYAIKIRNHWHVLLDDKTLVTDANGVPNNPIIISPDSQHVATIVQKDYRWQVTVDGKPWPVISTPELGLASFSPDGKHVAVAGQTKNSVILYEDGAPVPVPPESTKPFERIFPAYVWKPDSSAIGFYGAFPDKHWQVFTTDTPPFQSPQYDAILPGSPVFAPDSSRFAYGARTRGKWTLFTPIDQSPAPPFDEILPQSVLFLNTGQVPTLLYIARREALWQLYLNHQPIGDPFDTLIGGTLAVSPDRKHVAFAVSRGGQSFLIRDGKPFPLPPPVPPSSPPPPTAVDPSTLAFSPDSQHLAYAQRINNRWHVCIDTTIGDADFASVAPSPISFSPDSQNVAYAADLNPRAARLYVGVNAAYQSTFFDAFLPNARITWRDMTHLVTMAITKRVAYRVQATLPTRSLPARLP